MRPLSRSRAGRPRVLDLVAGQVRFELGSSADLGDPPKAAVLVHWAPTAVLSRSFRALATQLSAGGYRLVVVSACEAEQPLDWQGQCPAGTLVLRKPNIGYDFGSWAVALHQLPALCGAERLILANDSLVGPFAPLTEILARYEASGADVFAMTDTRQFFHHVQSYFLGFHRGVLAEPPLARFFADVREEATKWDVIDRYELGLNRLLRREGYGFASAFSSNEVVPEGDNPVITGWWRLIERGFPFVKREIVRNPQLAPNGDWVAREVEAVFGERVQEWV